MSAVGNLRRNPFWPIISRECFLHGFKEVTTQESKHKLVAIIHGYTAEGLRSTQEYVFPRTFKALESLRNFRSQFRNFLRHELPNRSFFPAPDHRTRQPGGTVAHFNHDVPKKKLAPPKSLQAAFGSLDGSIYDGLVCAPYVPDEPEKPAAPAKVRKQDPNEPVSDSKVLALFLVDVRDLSTLIEVAEGTARFRGSKPAPLRILGEQPKPEARPEAAAAAAVPLPQPSPLVNPQLEPLRPVRTRRIGVSRALPLSERIVERINSDRLRKWRSQDLSDLSASTNSIGPTLSILAASKRIVRVSRGVYSAAMTQ